MNLFFDLLKFVFAPTTPISLVINATILAIAAAILLWCIFYFLRIKAARARLAKLKKTFDGMEGGQTAQKIEDLANDDQIKHAWVTSRLAAIQKLKADTNATVDAIENLDMDLRWRVYGILRFPTNALIILGLLGTVWGLQDAVYSLLPTIRSQSISLASIKNVMTGTLQGMQTAFATTLAGLVCSLVIGFITSLGLKEYLNRYIDELKRFLIGSVIPLYSVMDTTYLEKLAKQARSLKDSVVSIAQQSDLLFQPVVASANKMSEGVGKIFEASQTFITASKAIEDFSANLSGSLTTLTTSLNEVRRAMDTYNKIQTDIEKSLQSIAGIPEQFKEFMSAIGEKFAGHQQKLQEAHESIIGEQREANEKEMTNLVTQFSGLLDKLGITSTKVVEAHGSLEKTWENFDKSQKTFAEQYVKANQDQYEKIKTALQGILADAQKHQDFKNKQVLDAISGWVINNQLLSDQFVKLPGNIAQAIRTNHSN